MVKKTIKKICPWCGQNEWHFAEKDIGQAEGWKCSKCNYTLDGKKL